MFLDLGLLLNAALFVFGLLWCNEMRRRWRTDLAEYRSTDDGSTRQVLLCLWVATAVIALLVVNFLACLLGAFL